MANWKHEIKIAEPWQQCHAGEITNVEMAEIIVNQLLNLPPDEDGEINGIAEIFQELVDNNENSDAEFNSCMVELYDWGDSEWENPIIPDSISNKMCFINTFG